MAQNVTIAGASYTDVTGIEVPKTGTGAGNALFSDVSDTTAVASDVLSGKSFYNASGVKTSGSIATKSSSNLTVSGATVTAPAGYYASSASKSVASGSATTPATTIASNPSISVSSGGLITASNSKTQSVTPTVTAGYVSSGTAGTITVSGSNTQQLTAKSAQTYTPGTSNQTIASGQYLTGTQTIAGDANLVPANIAQGVSIFGVTGTHSGGQPEEKFLNFYDYDGTLLYSYARGESFYPLPPNPSHQGLVSDGWNWSYEEIDAAKANYWYTNIDVGQLYHQSAYTTNTTLIFAHVPPTGQQYYMQLYFEGYTLISVYTNDGSGAYEDIHGQDQYVTIGPFYIMSDNTEFQIKVHNGRISFVNNDTHPIFRVDGNADGWENNKLLLDSIYKILIGENVSIGNRGLSYLQNLETIIIPNTDGITLYGIGAYAFEGCIKLKHVNLPAVFINEGCFKGCKKLRTVTFAWSEDVLEEIPDYCFLDSGIVHTSVPYSVYLVGEQAFKNSNLERLGMNVYGGPYDDPNPIYISANAFYNCIYYDGLIYLTDWLMFGIDSAITIDNYAYFGCKSMQMEVVLGYSINSIGDYAFSETCITNLRWDYEYQHDPAMSTIPTGCCKNCRNLIYVFLPETITDIYGEAFANCTSLFQLIFRSQVPPTVYNSNAFANLPTYCEIVVPEGTLSAYTSATNYPSSSIYTYSEM